MIRFLFLVVVLSLIITPVMGAQQPCAPAGQISIHDYTSHILDQEMVYAVYLPPHYDPAQAYPVLYLMHGSNSDHQHWLELGLPHDADRLIAQGEIEPLIVVMPYGDWIANRNWFLGERTWENVFLRELMPDVESQFVVSHRRAIGGISRGGFWAYSIGLRHPDLFDAIGGHSAFFDPGHEPADYNPLDLALTATGIDRLRLWLDRGQDDYAWLNFDRMHDHLTQRGLAHEYVVYPEGEHDNAYWSAHVADYLRFYAATPQSVDLFVPVVNLDSTLTNIPHIRLYAAAAGHLDPALVVDETTRRELAAHGVTLHPDTRIGDTISDGEYMLLPFDQLQPRWRMLWVDEQFILDRETYAFAFPDDDPNYRPERLTRIVMSGVTALARFTREAIEQNGIVWAGEAIRPYVTAADFFHISNESSFHPLCPRSDRPVLGGLCSREEHFDLLTYLDVDIVELSGNHNNDYGFDAYRSTLDMYDAAGILLVGGGATPEDARQPLILDHNDNQIALVSCNWNGPEYAWVNDTQPGAMRCTRSWLEATIGQLAGTYDVVIAITQYAEYDYIIDRQRNDFRQMAEWGADVVIGSQAHVALEPEIHAGAFVHYGLGNLFFDQTTKTRFFMDQLLIYDGRLLAVDLFAGVIEDRARPRPMTADERDVFMAEVFE